MTYITNGWLNKRKTRSKTIKGVLRAARRLLDKDGWTQGAYIERYHYTASGNPMGCMCMTGAICIAVGGADYLGCVRDRALLNGAFKAIAKHLYTDGRPLTNYVSERGIPIWNDHPERTKKEVLAIFDKAIKECNN